MWVLNLAVCLEGMRAVTAAAVCVGSEPGSVSGGHESRYCRSCVCVGSEPGSVSGGHENEKVRLTWYKQKRGPGAGK